MAVLVVSCVCESVCARSVFKSGGRIQRLFWPRWLGFTSARFKYPVNMKTVGQVDALSRNNDIVKKAMKRVLRRVAS